MTFAEKLARLRRREGLSQEALAEQLGVSRQAVSRWEQGTALPDAAKLLPCARLFRVSVDWLLDDRQGWEQQESAPEIPASPGDGKWYLAGGIVTGGGVLGMVVMGILSAVFPAVVTEAGMEWVRVYDGLTGFLKAHGVEWLFALWAAVTLAGLWLLAQPSLRKRNLKSSRFSPWYAAGVAAALYGVGQTAWYVQQGRRDLLLLVFFLAAAVWCILRQFQWLGGETDVTRRRRERLIALLYTAAQGVIVLLTAEAGFGLVALVFHIGVYFFYIGVMTGRWPGRRTNGT